MASTNFPTLSLARNTQEKSRTIYINDEARNQESNFIHNMVSTAKYNYLTFFPRFLTQEFAKYANVFFLMTSIIQQIDGVSPTSRYSTALPLFVVLCATGVKEVFEDYKRHNSDNEVNNRRTYKLKGGKFEPVLWSEIKVGDLVRVENGEFFPADLVLLSSSEPDALCYIETSSLDGETNLKVRQGRTETAEILSSQEASKLKGKIISELPNSSLYTFEATLNQGEGYALPLSPQQLLLRGAMLRNTRWIYGIVVFTGHDSKLMRNATAAPLKRTNVEDMTNRQIILLFLILLALAIASAASSLSFVLGNDSAIGYIYPNGIEPGRAWRQFGLDILTFIILYNNLIPISLIVTMEVVKLQQAFLINSDLDMYYETTDTPAQARTSSLVEELGQIQYIFSDKTGTLTRNEMEFRECSVGGIAYAENVADSQKIKYDPKSGMEVVGKFEFKHAKKLLSQRKQLSGRERVEAEQLHEFFMLLAICHTVIPEYKGETDQLLWKMKPENIVYQASSPDEGALVDGALRMGYFFHTRRPKSVVVHVDGEDLEYEILNICEFNSTRKRMSAIVKDPSGAIKLYIKGADTVILERLKRNEDMDPSDPKSLLKYNSCVPTTISQLEDYATEGLRTLCIAKKDISVEEYERWNNLYQKASTKINNRNEELDKVAEMIETNLIFIGATAIEDKLQVGVPDAIANLALAGIKLWVLTGDKQETAINIGYSCKLLTDEMTLLIVNENEKEAARAQIQSRLQLIQQSAQHFGVSLPKDRYNPDRVPKGIVYFLQHPFEYREVFEEWGWIDERERGSDEEKELIQNRGSPQESTGDYLDPSALEHLALIIDGKTLIYALEADLDKEFLQLATLCKSVICCRVSPLQKALIVKLVKSKLSSITLAIGDGANDVGMIQAAHVGVGISGHEGLQAARSADFAIGQFRYLKKLLLVHGAWSYRRLSKLILYSFYKNITLYLTQFWFAFSNGFSGQTIYESWTITLYNVLFVLLPPFAMGIFDQFLSARMLERYPQMYVLGQSRRFFNVPSFWGWTGNAIFHSIVLYYLVGYSMDVSTLTLGSPRGYDGATAGMWFVGTLLYTCVLATILIKAALITDHWTRFTWFFIPGSFVIWIIFLPIYSVVGPWFNIQELQGIETPLFGSAIFWLTIIVVPPIALMRDYVWKYFKRQELVEPYHIVQEIQKYSVPDYRPHAEKFLKAVKRVRMIQRMRKNRGYAFSQNEAGQADIIRQYDSTQKKPSGK